MKAALAIGMLMGLLAGAPARAGEPPAAAHECDVPSWLVSSDSVLSKVAESVRDQKKVDVLVVGSMSSTLPAAGGANVAYPARLEVALRDRLPGVTVGVSTDIQPKKTAEDVAGTLAPLVAARNPVLVVWQTGTADAIRSVDPDDFRNAVDEGVGALQRAGVDVVLMNAQYSPRTETMISLSSYLDSMRMVAQQHDIPMFDRFGIMRHWNESGDFDLFDPHQGLDVARRVHDCLGRALAMLVIDAAHLTPGGPQR